MTDDALLQRAIPVFVDKAKRVPRAGFTDDEWLECIVGTVVADTSMLLAGTLDLDAFT